MIKIIDYGLGNILAFRNTYKRLNVDVGIACRADDLDGATGLILPGVGAFDHAMELLVASGMRERLDSLVLDDKVPVIGICVGMQILATGSDEGSAAGLGWVDGRVKSLDTLQPGMMLPHMGWNDIRPTSPTPLLAGLETDARFYFLHSFYFDCNNPADVAAVSNYGTDFSCAVHHDNIYGVQFHPEKSHHFGIQLLKNFAERVAC